MSIRSFGGSLPSVSLHSDGESGFTAPSDNPCGGITLVHQIGLRKAADAKGIADANRYAAIHSGSDRNLVLTISSNASSAANSCQSSSPNSLRTISTTGTSIVSFPDAIQRPDARPAADVTADIKEFRREREGFYVKNWDNCFAAVKQECRETDPIIYRHQLAYEELLRRWQSKSLASSRSMLPSQGAAGPMTGDASSAHIATEPDRLHSEPVPICPAAGPDISGTYEREPLSLWSYRSSFLPSIDELPEREIKEEDAYHDYLGRKSIGVVVADRASLARQGSERSMLSKRTSRRELSLEDISPPPSSEVETISAVVQPENQAPQSNMPGAADIQDERPEKENKFTVEQLKLVPKQLKVKLADCGFSSLHDPYASPIEESGIVNPEVPDGADPATVSARIQDSAPPGASTPTCETPISQPSPLSGFNSGFDPEAESESPQGPSSISDFNADSDLGSISATTSGGLQSPVIAQPSPKVNIKKAPFDLEALRGIPVEKPWSRRDILSRLKPAHRITRPGPRQTMSRENLRCWWARRAARRRERRSRPPELGISDLTSMSFTSSSVSGVTESEGSGKEFSVGSRHGSDNGSEGTSDSSSEASGRRDGFDEPEPPVVRFINNENVESRKLHHRGRFPKFSRSRPRTGHQSLFAKFQRRKKPLRIID